MKKLFFLFLSACLILFVSCENFMNGSEVQDQLEKMIDVANAKSCTIVVSQDTSMGSFLSSGDKTCKIGHTIDVQYTVKKDLYVYKGLKAVSKSDETKSMSSYIEFTQIDNDSTRGVYKTSIKLVKESDDILIVPDCVLIPAVITDQCKPDNYPNAWEQDSVINIVFNKPVITTEFFVPVITDGSGENISSYFGESYLSADSEVLYIPVANGKQLLKADDKAEIRDVIITIDLSTVTDEEGNFGSGKIQHKYRVNKSKDNIKPELKAVSLYSTSDKTKAYYKELVNTVYSSWTYNKTDFGDYNKNHVGSSVYVEFDAEDVGSGVSSFIVKETLIKSDQGIAGGDIVLTSKPQPATKSEETGRLSASYTIGTSSDGIVKLEFFACDNSGNISNNSIAYYVLKDTTIKNDSITLKNNNSDLFVPLQNGSYSVTPEERLAFITSLNNTVSNNIQTVSLIIEENSADIYYYDSVQAATDSDINSVTAARTPYDFELYWSYSAEEITTGPIAKENGAYTFTRDVDKVVYVKIAATDSVGNTKEIVKTIAPRLKLTILSVREDLDFENSNSLPTMCGADGSNVDIGYSGAYMTFYAQYNLTYGDTAKSYTKIINHFSDILNEIEDISQNPTGTVKVYAIPKFGDITAPISSNYYEYTIQGWNENPGNGADQIGELFLEMEEPPVNIFGKTKLSDALPSTPPAAEYGPISERITVNVTPLPKTRLCKVEISNYIRNGFNKDDYIFKFYQTEIFYYPGEGYVAADPTVYSDPVFYTKVSENPDCSKGFGIQIEAYSLLEKKWYRPKQFIAKGEGGQELTETTITNTFLCDLYKLDYDFTAPRIDTGWINNGTMGYNSQFMQGGFYIYSGISDTHDNLDKQSTLSYYIIPNSDTKVSDGIRAYTIDELENYYSAYKKTMYYRPFSYGENADFMTTAERTVGIPFGNTENGYYTVVVTAADKMGNTAIHAAPALVLDRGELPWKIERNYTSTNLENSVNSDNLENPNDSESPQETTAIMVSTRWKFTLNTKNNPEVVITESENEEYGFTQVSSSVVTFVDRIKTNPDSYSYPWDDNPSIILNDYQSADSYEEHNAQNNTYYTITSIQNPLTPNDSEWSPWVRLRSYIKFPDYEPEEAESYWSDKGSYYYDYFYCGTNDSICYSKNCIEGLNGIQVFSDRPVFTHTMYSDEPLTTSKYDDNAVRIWENKGVETGARVVNKTINEDFSHASYTIYPDHPENNPNSDNWHLVGSETYGNENIKTVPKGFWYTTIFHFADGSTAMTDIKQKQ